MSDVFIAKDNGLTLTEWYLLKYLIEHEFASKDELLTRLHVSSDGCLYALLSKLRKKINNKSLIQPLYGHGYYISPPIRLILLKRIKAHKTSHTIPDIKKELESIYV